MLIKFKSKFTYALDSIAYYLIMKNKKTFQLY